MLNVIFKFIIMICVISFFAIVLNYYFSDKNINQVKNNRITIDAKKLKDISKLPFLPNDKNDIIEFNSGFENSYDQNFKRSFWDLFN